jgi:hypothetical protein
MTESARDSYGARRWTTMSSDRRHTGFDQLDPPAIHDLVAGRCSDSHGPAQMMGDPHTHALKYLSSQV